MWLQLMFMIGDGDVTMIIFMVIMILAMIDGGGESNDD